MSISFTLSGRHVSIEWQRPLLRPATPRGIQCRTSRHVPADVTDRGDGELVRSALGGEAAAFELLVQRYARPAFLIALSATGNSSDAEDAVQDAFVQCHEHLGECRNPDRFAAWLLRIVRNRAHNVRRREGIREAVPLVDIDERSHHGATSLASAAERADARMLRTELREQLLSALSLEPEVRRQVLVLHDLEEWTHRDIASALGISILMSRFHLSAVRRSMRARLAQYRSNTRDD
jgi:RNA polymerase sigma-70 factor, ECF subfamily